MTRLSPEDTDALAMEYALGLLEAHAERIETLMADDPVLASRVGYWRATFSEIDFTASPTLASASLWRSIEDAVAAGLAPEPRRRPAASRRGPSFWSDAGLWRWSTLGAATAAVVMAVVLAAQMLGPDKPTAVMVAVLEQESDGKPLAIVETFSDGTVRLVPLQRINVPRGRALQVWTKRNDEEGPISVGLLDQARTLKLDLGALPAPVSSQLFEITLEPETGSPTGRPTGEILMKGLTANTL
ncbi:MAG: anti-sigma factor [Hyphomicrobiales bacterium]|nr:anti-sigma factor [Hyphomicrobiales bacterium]